MVGKTETLVVTSGTRSVVVATPAVDPSLLLDKTKAALIREMQTFSAKVATINSLTSRAAITSTKGSTITNSSTTLAITTTKVTTMQTTIIMVTLGAITKIRATPQRVAEEAEAVEASEEAAITTIIPSRADMIITEAVAEAWEARTTTKATIQEASATTISPLTITTRLAAASTIKIVTATTITVG